MRVFIALDISDDSKNDLIIMQDRLKDLTLQCKWVDLIKHAHLTLRFWSDVDDNQLADIKTAMDVLKSNFSPMSVVVKETSTYSDLKKKQVLWYTMADSIELENIYDFLSAQLEVRGFAYEDQPFVPHITLGRLRARKNLNSYKKFLQKEMKNNRCFSVLFPSLSLYKSTLSQEGPEYELLYRI